MSTVIWWIRRDLRLENNPALEQALASSRQVIPVYVIDNNLYSGASNCQNRCNFLVDGLRKLDERLQSQGVRLILRQGKPIEELGRLVYEAQATRIFAEPDYSPYASKRDFNISQELPITWAGSPAIHLPGEVLKPDGNPYIMFTPFRRTWKSLDLPINIKQENYPQFDPSSNYLPSLALSDLSLSQSKLFPAGEVEARHRLEIFIRTIEGETNLLPPISRYEITRNRLDLDDTSRLSPYLRFGMLSAREVADAARAATQSSLEIDAARSAECWLDELIWRDFYIHILYHFPRVQKENFRSLNVRWNNDPNDFQAWCAGETGYPIVDAAMRQLEQTGWMHNRARMIVASFLTKDLLIDWRWGAKWFMQHLIDGDPAANNGGWQWSAGTGTDAAPYFRIFNPVTQGQKYDPQGAFIRAWLPELAGVPAEYIHAPWGMPNSVQLKSGCQIGGNYPLPIVDHAWARQRALQAFSKPKPIK